MLDMWYNPGIWCFVFVFTLINFFIAVEEQACDRVHRIGQTKPVFIHRFLVENSVEVASLLAPILLINQIGTTDKNSRRQKELGR